MPVYDVDITSDIEQVMREVDVFFEKDIPFTVAGALNDTAFDVRRRIVGATFQNAFTVRNNRFPGTLWKVDKIALGGRDSQLSRFKSGDINTMTAMVRQKLDRGYIEDHIVGGTKLPRGSSIAVPSDGGSGLRTKSGRIAKRNKPLEIVNRRDHFLVKDKGGRKRFIARRNGSALDIVFRFTQSANIAPRFRFYQDAFDTVDRVMLRHWGNRMATVVNRSRFSR